MYLQEKGLWDWWACWAPDWPYWRCHCDSNAEPPSWPSVAPDHNPARVPLNAISEWQLAVSRVKEHPPFFYLVSTGSKQYTQLQQTKTHRLQHIKENYDGGPKWQEVICGFHWQGAGKLTTILQINASKYWVHSFKSKPSNKAAPCLVAFF